MPYGLPPEALDRLVALLRRERLIRNIWLYGSRALERETTGSDIDICLEAASLGMSELAVLEAQIDDLLLPWKVDLVLLHQIDDPDLLAHIQRAGVEVKGYMASASEKQGRVG